MGSRRSALRRIAIYAALVGTAFGLLARTGSLPSAGEARDFAERLGGFAVAAYVPLFVVANLLIAWPILGGAGGLLFGTAAGTPLALAGVTLAALVQMWIVRRQIGVGRRAASP